jgi:signal peptidase I
VFLNGTKLLEPYVFKEDDGQTQTTESLGDVNTWVVPDGQLFLMGDHRGNSADSRVFGPVDVSAVIGRAWLRYWPITTFEIIDTPKHPELATPAP